ncbi:MAG: hypothetical protein JEZ00_12010 [Anaerolineaceae bacterium]|nr:hypothetical protein [Anaerolineaceae bacterium]
METVLHHAIQCAKQNHAKYDVIVSFSGGKDSVFVLKQLVTKYNARVLCVLDDLNQQTKEAMDNAKRSIDDLDADLYIISPPEEEPEIRRNFLKNGENFCRLCLRSHFARVYQVAIEMEIPYVFLGLSPFQVLDCPNAIDWSLHAIHDLETPPENRDNKEILSRYQHRFFQGGYDRGFVKENEKILLSNWMNTFEPHNKKIIPLLLPFFIFDGYPGDEKVMEIITHELDWKKPDYYIFRRSNCRWQQPAGLIHYAIFQTHMNYKEIATELRLAGKRLTYDQAIKKYNEINQLSVDEIMSKEEFQKILLNDFGMRVEELPTNIKDNITRLLL